MWQDNVNGLYELLGGVFVFLHCRQLYRDKSFKGVNLQSFMFFASWGIWNLYYYPSLNQWWSLIGGIHIVFWNIVWIVLAFKYKENK